MSLLSKTQRAVVRQSTGIDPLIIDRATDAFDALLSRGDVEAYKKFMGTAVAQMAYGRPVKTEDRPTAVDKVKTILIKAYADQERISFPMAARDLKRRLEAGGGA